jgi:hypothetical protein
MSTAVTGDGFEGLHSRSVLRRFWSKIDRRGPDECWPWIGYRDQRGGAKFNLGGRGKGTIQAQRFAWIIARGPIPPNRQVIHTCPTRWCMNARHLKPGTAVDRGGEAFRLGRTPFGERHHKARLTAGEVRKIRACLNARSRPSLRAVAARFGLAPKHVSDIWKFRLWTHVGGPAIPFDDVRAKRRRFRSRRSRPRCPDSVVETVRALQGGLFSATEVATLLGVGRSTVSRVWRNTRPTLPDGSSLPST